MGTESIESSFLSIFALISFTFLIVCKYSHKIRGSALLDKDFEATSFSRTSRHSKWGIATIVSLSFFL